MRYFVRLTVGYMEVDFEFPTMDEAVEFAEKAVEHRERGELKVLILITAPSDIEVEVEHDREN